MPCETKAEAEAIAAAPVLEYESLEGLRSGSTFAEALEKTAQAYAKYRMGFGARFFQYRAVEARRKG